MRTGWLFAACLVLVGAAAGAATVKVEKEPIVLGRTESVTMRFEVDEPPGTEDRPLALKTNVGSFGEVSRLGPGRYSAVYIPPPTRFPQVALIAVWRETGPEAAIDFLRVALHGVTKIAVKAKPGSEVKLTAGSETTEPMLVGAKGEVLATLVVPPGVAKAELTAKDPRGLVTQRTLGVDVPPYNRLTAALVPHALRADGTSWARLEVFYDLGGADVPPSKIEVTPSAGAVTFLSAERGRYVYRYLAPAGLKQPSVRFTVAIKGDPASTATAVLSLTPPTVQRLVVRPPSAILAPDGKSRGTVQVLVLDAAGLGVLSQPLTVTANGEPLPVVERASGLYEATYRAPGRYPADGRVQLLATVGGSAVSGTASFQLRAPPVPRAMSAKASPDPAPADGSTEVEILIDLKDGSGQPLDGASLMLTAERGTVTAPLDEGGGRYRATFVPSASGGSTATIRVRDATGAFEQPISVSLRDAARFELGVQGGFSHSLGDQLSPRAAVELWRGFLLGKLTLGAGVTVGYGSATQVISDVSGAQLSRSQAHFVPISVRLGYELVSTGRFSLVAGAAGIATYARMSTALTGVESSAWGFGGGGFVAGGLLLGPGRLMIEAGYGFVPVKTPSFNLQAGGLTVGLGYRFLL